MTPLEALQLLENATAHLNSDRPTHVKIMEALRIVGDALVAANKAKESQDKVG